MFLIISILMYLLVIGTVAFSNDNLTRTVLQGLSLILVFNKDIIMNRLNIPPLIKMINKPSCSSKDIHIALKFDRTLKTHKINNICIESEWLDKFSLSIDSIDIDNFSLNDESPFAILDVKVKGNTVRSPLIFNIKYCSNGKGYTRKITLR